MRNLFLGLVLGFFVGWAIVGFALGKFVATTQTTPDQQEQFRTEVREFLRLQIEINEILLLEAVDDIEERLQDELQGFPEIDPAESEIPWLNQAQVDTLLDSIAYVESRHDDEAVGDNGKALGRYQIHRAYWMDAVEFDPTLSTRNYESVKDPEYARKVVIAYFNRYGSTHRYSPLDLARLHNGGPRGPHLVATNVYEQKVNDASNGILQ